MAYDQIFTINDYRAELKIVPILLNRDKNIFLLQIFEENQKIGKKYIRNQLVLVGDYLLTSSFSDTVHFFEELHLFDTGNNQNKYLKVVEHQKTKNLQLEMHSGEKIFLSKSEAKAIYKIYNLSFVGYSVAILLEDEFEFTPQMLTKLLHKHNFLQG